MQLEDIVLNEIEKIKEIFINAITTNVLSRVRTTRLVYLFDSVGNDVYLHIDKDQKQLDIITMLEGTNLVYNALSDYTIYQLIEVWKVVKESPLKPAKNPAFEINQESLN